MSFSKNCWKIVKVSLNVALDTRKVYWKSERMIRSDVQRLSRTTVLRLTM